MFDIDISKHLSVVTSLTLITRFNLAIKVKLMKNNNCAVALLCLAFKNDYLMCESNDEDVYMAT